jgi:hypothetical protein
MRYKDLLPVVIQLVAILVLGEFFDRLGIAGRWGRLAGCGAALLPGQILFVISGLRNGGVFFLVRCLIGIGAFTSICLIIANGYATDFNHLHVLNIYIHLLAVVGVIALFVWAVGKLGTRGLGEELKRGSVVSGSKPNPFIGLS